MKIGEQNQASFLCEIFRGITEDWARSIAETGTASPETLKELDNEMLYNHFKKCALCNSMLIEQIDWLYHNLDHDSAIRLFQTRTIGSVYGVCFPYIDKLEAEATQKEYGCSCLMARKK